MVYTTYKNGDDWGYLGDGVLTSFNQVIDFGVPFRAL